MGRARRGAGDIRDLFERQATPQVGDDDLAFLDGEKVQLCGGLFSIDAVRTFMRIGFEPRGGAGRGGRFVTAPAPRSDAQVDGLVADNLEEPGGGVFGQGTKASQLQKRLLHHVFRRIAPLPRVKGERGGVLVQEVS
jgi:hypothetical protein